GTDRVVTGENDKVKSDTSDGYAQAFLAVYGEEKTEGIVFGHTAIGKDLSPKLAAKLEAGLVSDVTALEVAGGNVVFKRQIYS
ncbi:electron transfer flavoprotein subunit alpha/FixB family protein, partial [Bacillus pseudomycoides]|nr:electron transfer flavoprotein subunit alpha/FixB family protein [Bacillus pseudomycoides]